MLSILHTCQTPATTSSMKDLLFWQDLSDTALLESGLVKAVCLAYTDPSKDVNLSLLVAIKGSAPTRNRILQYRVKPI